MEEFREERMEMEEAGEVEEESRRNLLLVMTSSWGISFVIHLILILILMGIFLVVPQKKKPPVIISRPAKVEQPIDETLPPFIISTPVIKDPIIKEKPVNVFTPVKVESKQPKGDPNNSSNKNLNSHRTMDVYGTGGGSAGPYGSRFGKGKWKTPGGGKGAETGVRLALEWLKRHQSPEGFWKSNNYDDYCSRNPKCKNQYLGHSKDEAREDFRVGRGMDGYDAGVTGLATLAFLGHGNTHKVGRYRKVVRRALQWIQKIQVNDPNSPWHGSIGYIMDGKKVEHPEWIYNHAISTMALCEAYAITGDSALRKNAQSAVDFIIKCQNPGLGWRYDSQNPEKAIRPGQNDTSVTGWMVLALKAAKQSGVWEGQKIRVPQRAFAGAVQWFERITNASGQAGYMTPGGSSSMLVGDDGKPRDFYREVPTTTAVSLLCRLFAGQSRSHPGLRKGRQILMNSQPQWDNFTTVNMYYWYYATYAMFQMGGKKWNCGRKYASRKALQNKKCHCWNHSMQKALVLTQRWKPKSCVRGSWDPIGEWGIAGGRVYSTAMGALTLQIYYRYKRMMKH